MGLRGLLRRLGLDRRGGIATTFAIAVPVLVVLACGAIDLTSVRSDDSAMQDAADAAALDAAKQLGVSDEAGISARAGPFAAVQLGDSAARLGVTATTTFGKDDSSVTVTLTGHRPSFFANLLPPGGWTLHTSATAASLGRTPLCVLSSGSSGADQITMTDQSQITANNCLVQSNNNVAVEGSASLQAGLVQAVGTASGNITPAPQSGAPPIADPFASLAINPNGLICNPLDLVYDIGVTVLTPGIHCGNITVRKNAVVQMLPGEYYFLNGHLTMMDNSQLVGSNVVLVFDSKSTFTFQDGAQIDLRGRTGRSPLAGFVIATTRDNTGTFTISSSAARELLGTIYIPNATLAVSGANNLVADQSAWTVVVARAISVGGSANLVINANYAGSTVPVPSGVGPRGGKVMLTR
ncbi:MAG TPA: pilus assembly protein TadG-related protein [Caulobacteraceae bacterium]|nr:pilus assembly protein TadG-related protein [Caulobacteraceae bacterium]